MANEKPNGTLKVEAEKEADQGLEEERADRRAAKEKIKKEAYELARANAT